MLVFFNLFVEKKAEDSLLYLFIVFSYYLLLKTVGIRLATARTATTEAPIHTPISSLAIINTAQKITITNTNIK
jgi:hypothetical protein